ncbi:MAG: hypothetical protein V3T39_04855 [Gammaproteobacteria bacterium]
MKHGIRYLLLILLAGVLVAGCSGNTRVKSDLNVKRAPDWVNKGYQALKNRDGRLVHGRGSAEPMNDLSLQRAVADNRARAEIAGFLSTYLTQLADDFSSANATDENVANEQIFSRQITTLTEQNLSSVSIIANWRDKKTENVWSLAELDMRGFKDVIENANYLNAELRTHILQNADNIFDRIVQEN